MAKANAKGTQAGIRTLTDEVFDEFVRVVAAADGLEEVAKRLRSIVIDKRSFTDASIRAALLDEESV